MAEEAITLLFCHLCQLFYTAATGSPVTSCPIAQQLFSSMTATALNAGSICSVKAAVITASQESSQVSDLSGSSSFHYLLGFLYNRNKFCCLLIGNSNIIEIISYISHFVFLLKHVKINIGIRNNNTSHNRPPCLKTRPSCKDFKIKKLILRRLSALGRVLQAVTKHPIISSFTTIFSYVTYQATHAPFLDQYFILVFQPSLYFSCGLETANGYIKLKYILTF